MDLATLAGILAGIGLISAAIVNGGQPALFFEPGSFLIVVGGTIATTFIRFPAGRVLKMIGVAKNAFFSRTPDPHDVIQELVDTSRTARKEGLLSLENYETDDAFLKLGIQLVVDGSNADILEDVLGTGIRSLQRRHKDGQEILKGIGDAAPAFGMIGTLIGLVTMLANMDDVKSLGPAMAVAILTTLYGALIANVVALPLAKKLEVRSREETLTRELRMVGLLNIQKGENPRMIQTHLNAYLRRKSDEEERPRPKEVKTA